MKFNKQTTPFIYIKIDQLLLLCTHLRCVNSSLYLLFLFYLSRIIEGCSEAGCGVGGWGPGMGNSWHREMWDMAHPIRKTWDKLRECQREIRQSKQYEAYIVRKRIQYEGTRIIYWWWNPTNQVIINKEFENDKELLMSITVI